MEDGGKKDSIVIHHGPKNIVDLNYTDNKD